MRAEPSRFATGSLAALLLAQACGGLNSAEVTIIPDGAAAGGSASGAPTETGGQDADSGGEPNGGTAALGGAASEGCRSGAPCDNGAQPGICVDGACVACVDEDDDPACVTAYGKGQLCIDSACVEADCRKEDDCDGGACIDGRCVSCTTDADCLEPDTICNTSTGACVTNASCGDAAGGAACPVNAQDRCCGVSGVCAAVACCGIEACKTTSDQKTNDGKCRNGLCVSNACQAPIGTTRYVDFDAEAGGSGAKACPFNRLGAAFDDLAATGGQVVVKAGSAVTVDSPAAMPPGVGVIGGDDSFEPCTKDSCSDPSTWPTITTGDHRALNLTTPGNRSLRFARFVGLPEGKKDDAQWAAIYVSAASLAIDHVEISGYQYGLYADTAGSITIGGGMNVHHNRSGLYVADGDGALGGSAEIVVPTGGEASHFDYNIIGLNVHGNGLLQLKAPAAGAKAAGLITANHNAGSGVYFPASHADGAIEGLEAAFNGSSALSPQRDGATFFAHAVVKVRSSYFHDNAGSGVHVPGNGPNSADGLSAINLGVNAGSGAGKNTFIDNELAGICVEKGPAEAATQNSFKVAGNYFRASGGDCTSGGKYTRASECKGGVDYAGACAGAADFTSCTPSGATCE